MTRPPITGDQTYVKSINRNVVLRLLLDEPGLSRATLAERSGLTKSTVSLLAKELLDEGWLDEDSVASLGSKYGSLLRTATSWISCGGFLMLMSQGGTGAFCCCDDDAAICDDASGSFAK